MCLVSTADQPELDASICVILWDRSPQGNCYGISGARVSRIKSETVANGHVSQGRDVYLDWYLDPTVPAVTIVLVLRVVSVSLVIGFF